MSESFSEPEDGATAESDVESNDVCGAALQQAVREAAGTGTSVERAPARHIEPESVERGVEFVATTTDEACTGTLEHDCVTGMDLS